MPTYEYQCQRCRRRQEVFQSIVAKPLTRCPACSGRLKRLIGSGSGFLFKGSGFYITDYRSQGYREAKQKEQPSAPSTESTAPTQPSGKETSGKPTGGTGERKT